MGFVGVSYDVKIAGINLFFAGIHAHGGPALVRRFLPDLGYQIWDGDIEPGKVLDMAVPLDDAAKGYEAMDQRSAIKVRRAR